MEFINNKIKIKLTQYGVNLLKAKNKPSYKHSFNPLNNILTEQLSIVINTFGNDIHGGSEQLFIDSIIEA